MAASRKPGPLNPPLGECRIPARTCGPLGFHDQGDPNVTSLLGDTPGPLGWQDWGTPDLPFWSTRTYGVMACKTTEGIPLAPAISSPSADQQTRFSVQLLALSTQAMTLLKEIETLRLKPYDDQSGKEVSAWVKGATVGYGHLIKNNDWNTYKNGITELAADQLFVNDLAPFVSIMQNTITSNRSLPP